MAGSPPFRAVTTRAEFDALLRAATNYERMPEFHAGQVRFDLERMRAFVARLGHPERASPVVHVTGTKGKGSTATLVAAMLRGAGSRVGLHTSPHLHRMEERVAVDGEPIPEADLLRATNRVLAAQVDGPDLGFPTYFELMTLVAFLHFAARGCAFAVHEVGMGGALDATNVVVPAACAITNVALEHVAILGDTVQRIAAQKAGIVKPGAPVVTAVREGDPALEPIDAAAERAGVPLLRIGRDFRIARLATVPGGIDVDVETWRSTWRGLRPALAGEHQAQNVAVAVALVETLRERGLVAADETRLAAGIAGLAIPCRLETVATRPRVIVDGAHTPESIAAAVAAVREAHPAARLVVVFAMARDKDCAGGARALAGASLAIATGYDSERRTDPAQLAACAGAAGIENRCEPDWKNALAIARRTAEIDGLVLVLGSLYLAAAVRAHVLANEGRAPPQQRAVES